jgi:phenylalanyl-tRNA synthetase beta chain
MKFSYNWIGELVEGLEASPLELMRLITMKTAEGEGVEEVGPVLATATLAEVLEAEPIAGSHNRKARVRTEKYGERLVVCGAGNCVAGLKTIYVPLGVKTIDGIPSDGMLASERDLGIGNNHAGILEIDSMQGLVPDWVIEIDNKSLTHRPDLWGHHGMAREVAAITGKKVRDPADVSLIPEGQSAVRVEISDFSLCPRYSALVFENVKVGPSPAWLRWRLEAVGLNAINNIVDVTNFINAELAQPMHAFDADRVQGSTIFVRPGRAGETIVALNKETYEVGPANLLIADAAGPIAIAGVMGGLDSAIHDGTNRIIFESANFLASSVRKTSVQLKLRTDASMRFEKSQDPLNTVRGLARAIELLREVSPGIRLVGGLEDVWQKAPPPAPIDLPVAWLRKKLGRDIGADEVRDILTSLGFGVTEPEAGMLRVAVPSWRATKDVSIKDDLVEEVGRMVGYDSISPRPPLVAATVPPQDPWRAFLNRTRDAVAAQGFTEVSNYSFVNEEMTARFGFEEDGHLRVLNPIASDQTMLRTSLLPRIFENIVSNSRHLGSFRLFEIGREIHKQVNETAVQPKETPHLAAAIFAKDDGAAGLFELKRLAECLLPGCAVEPAEARAFEHPHRAAEVVRQGETLGRLFELHPSLGLEGRAAVLDLDLTAAQRLRKPDVKYEPLRRYPTSAFDLSVIAAERTPAGRVQRELTALAGSDLVSNEYQRQFALSEGGVSLSYRLTVGARGRTLSSEEVMAIRSRVIEGMRELGYELRV